MLYLGYLFTVINYVFYCASRFMKDKKDILFMDLIAKAFTVAGLYCLGSMTGVYSMSLMFLINIVCYYKERKQARLPFLYWLSLALYFYILYSTYVGISSVLVFTTSVLTITANWWFPPQWMRLSAVFGCVLYLGYQYSIQNWGGILELASLGSNAVSYYKYRKQDISENS